MGGSKSPVLNNLAIELWEWCIHRNIWVTAVHIAGKLNVDVDLKSRNFTDKHQDVKRECVHRHFKRVPRG